MTGQISLEQYYGQTEVFSILCKYCLCERCLYYWSKRCPYGECYDDFRAKERPYNKAHPNKPPRKGWTTWETDQAYWCRGGSFYYTLNCPHFVKYQHEKTRVVSCLEAMVDIYQDGYMECCLVDDVGCEECYRRFSERMKE